MGTKEKIEVEVFIFKEYHWAVVPICDRVKLLFCTSLVIIVAASNFSFKKFFTEPKKYWVSHNQSNGQVLMDEK